jgi:hypothetical protein
LDFGAARDGVPESDRGRRIVVDLEGNEVSENDLMDEGIQLDSLTNKSITNGTFVDGE